MGSISDARTTFNEMQTQLSCIDGLDSRAFVATPPQDTAQDDLPAGLAVTLHFAEAKLLIKEGNENQALVILEDLMSRYPRQLSLPEFRELGGEADLYRGMLLANADRWLEAGEFLKQARPPKAYRAVWSYYLGQYYYTVRDYERAAKMLKVSMTANMPPQWQSRAHHMLGLAEYHLSHIEEAKKHFELSVRIADAEYIRRNNIWGWLEKTSLALGQNSELERYRQMRAASESAEVN
jgi:tetratricopeptide (TPR) repeat protein